MSTAVLLWCMTTCADIGEVNIYTADVPQAACASETALMWLLVSSYATAKARAGELSGEVARPAMMRAFCLRALR